MSEEMLGIIETWKNRLVLTTDRLIVARRGTLAGLDTSSIAGGLYAVPGGVLIGGAIAAIGGAIKGRAEEKEREKMVAQLSPEAILSADRRNFVIPWSDVVRAEAAKEGWLAFWAQSGEVGMRLKIMTTGKKHVFRKITGRMLGKCWSVLNTAIPDKVTVLRDREKFDKEISKLENTPVDVLCRYLRSLGFEAEVPMEEEIEPATAMALTGYFDEAVAEIKGRNISYIQTKCSKLNWGMACILKDVTGNWEFTETKRRGHEDFQWVGDSRISDPLNQDISVKDALLQEMRAKQIRDVGIAEPEDNFASIIVWPKEHLPSKSLLEALDKIAGHLHKIT